MICRTIVSLTLFFIFASSLHAAVMERNWKAPGDGLLTYDDVNQREWLDLSQTLRLNFPPNFLISDVVMELEPGGMFEGFTWANIEDVVAFAQSAGIDTNTLDVGVNGVAVEELLDLIGRTRGPLPPLNNSSSITFLNEIVQSPSGDLRQAVAIFTSQLSGPESGLILSHTAGDDGRPSTSALMFYRNVPEPNSIALMALFIAGIGLAELIW